MANLLINQIFLFFFNDIYGTKNIFDEKLLFLIFFIRKQFYVHPNLSLHFLKFTLVNHIMLSLVEYQ
jgi:hypothetical protein